MAESTERRDVIAAMRGDLVAYDRLVRLYRQPLVRACEPIAGCREAAEDAAQMALIQGYKNLPQLRDPEGFGPWIRAIARRFALRRRDLRDQSWDGSVIDRFVADRLGSLGDRRHDEDLALRLGVRSLPPEEQEPVALHHLDGWDVASIAEFLDLPPTTVKWRLHQGRTRLKRLLGEEFLERTPWK